MNTLNIEIATDHEEAAEFVNYLNELGHNASIGNSTGNFVDGHATGTEEADDIFNLNDAWSDYCDSNVKTLSESLNFSREQHALSYKIKVTETENIAAYDTLCLICDALKVNADAINDNDFDSASIALDDAYKSVQCDIRATNDNIINMYVWIDL